MSATASARFKSAKSRTPREECIWDANKKENSSIEIVRPSTSHPFKRTHPLAGKETVRIISNFGVRDLLIPSNQNNIYSRVWPETELKRLHEKAKINTVQDIMEVMQKNQTENLRLKQESEARKQKLREIDNAKALTKLDNLEKISAATDEVETIKILDRAYLAKQEREEEVKKANRIILATKCHLIRDAQIAEKNEIAREYREDDVRLEKMMLDERDKALIEEDIKRQAERQKVKKYSDEIRRQLLEKESMKQKEVDRIEEEALIMKRSLASMEKDEQEKTKLRQAKTQKIRQELHQSSEWSTYFKNLEFKKERIAELKIQEYMRQKHEREKQQALERRLAKEAKDREFDLLLLRQQKLLDTKAEKHEIEYRRQQERVEREFRRKEKEAAIKKREMEKSIAIARAVQLEEVKRLRAIQCVRDEEDFKSSLQKMKEEQAREENKKIAFNLNKDKYREEIISQMTQKELNRREFKEKLKRDFVSDVEAQKQTESNIKCIIRSKIKDMQDSQIPERFIKDVVRQLKISAK